MISAAVQNMDGIRPEDVKGKNRETLILQVANGLPCRVVNTKGMHSLIRLCIHNAYS